MRVAVIFGGRSPESDVSVITGMQIYHHLAELDYEVYPIYVTKEGECLTYKKLDISYFQKQRHKKHKQNVLFVHQGIKIKKFVKLDLAIIAMHGINGEDGMMAGVLKHARIPYVGSNSISSGIAIDKYYTYLVLKDFISMVDTTLINEGSENVTPEYYPLIIKPSRLGSSIGIQKASDDASFKRGLMEAFIYDSRLVIQPFLENAAEYNIALFKYQGEIVTSAIERIEKREDILTYEDKYLGDKMASSHNLSPDIPIELANEIKEVSKKAYRILDLSGVVRLDFLYTDRLYLNEVNTIPGAYANYLFEGKFAYLIPKLIHEAIFSFKQEKEVTFSSNILDSTISIKK